MYLIILESPCQSLVIVPLLFSGLPSTIPHGPVTFVSTMLIMRGLVN
jgi:hypothetical protein